MKTFEEIAKSEREALKDCRDFNILIDMAKDLMGPIADAERVNDGQELESLLRKKVALKHAADLIAIQHMNRKGGCFYE